MALSTHEDHFAAVPPNVRPWLEQIQTEVERRLPDAARCISYRMPAYRLGGGKGKVFFFFAAFKRHIGVYPPVRDPSLDAELDRYRGPKGNLVFPLGEPLPVALIGRVACALARQYSS